MPSEWRAVCKDCGEAFAYSDFVHRQRLKRGLSAPERCMKHRKRHAEETRAMASSHFGLEPLKRPNLLGMPFLGGFDRADRTRPQLNEFTANASGMDLGLKEEHVAEIYRALDTNKVLVVVAPTGAGKSTMIPYRLLAPMESSGLAHDHFTAQGRKIVVTQPRRDATGEIPATIAEKLHGSSVGPGSEIGFSHSQDRDRTDPWNRLVFVTDGTLANWLTDQRAGEFSIIIVDEAHERSTTIDLILGLMRTELVRHPHLKLMILSATIHADNFVRFFNEVLPGRVWLRDFAECEKNFGYEVAWHGRDPVAAGEMVDAVADKVTEILRTTEDGGILAFLPGKAEISEAIRRIDERLDRALRKRTLVVPLHAALSAQERARATGIVEPQKGVTPRRVVVATNVAETSLTIPDIAFVVDSGLVKESVWDVASRTDSLPTRWHSQAGCRQRWGRAGRNRPGTVHPLYTQSQFEEFEPHTSPAAVRERLDEVFVRAKRAGIGSLDVFPWLDAPPEPELQRLERLGADRHYLDSDGDLTERGSEVFDLYRRLGAFLGEGKSAARGLDIAALLLFADRFACLIEAATLVVLLERVGERLYHPEAGLLQFDPVWPLAKIDAVQRAQLSLRAGCSDDLDFVLKLVALHEGVTVGTSRLGGPAWARDVRLNVASMTQALDERDQILRAFNRDAADRGLRALHPPWFGRLRLMASAAWPDFAVALAGNGRWRGDDGEQGAISIHSVLAGRTGGGVVAVAAYGRHEPDEDGHYPGPPIASVLVRIDQAKAALDDTALVAEVRRLPSESDEVAARLFADAGRPVGSMLEDGSRILRWTTGDDGRPAPEIDRAPQPLDLDTVADRPFLTVRFERMIPNPRRGQPTGFVGIADVGSVMVDAGDLGLAGAVCESALLDGSETALRICGGGPGGPRLSLLSALEDDWARLAGAGEAMGTAAETPEVSTGAGSIRIWLPIAGLPQARHLAVCALPRQRAHLESLKAGDRVWLQLRPSDERDWVWTLRQRESEQAARAAPDQIKALAALGLSLTDETLRAERRMSVVTLDAALAAAPMLERPIRSLFARCHMLWGQPNSLETAASVRLARELWSQARTMWDQAWIAETSSTRDAVKAFQPILKEAPISSLQTKSLRGVVDDIWKIADLRSLGERAASKRAWVARRTAGADSRIASLRANIAKNEASLASARSTSFAAKCSTWLFDDRQKLAAMLHTRPAEEAEWAAALREARDLEKAAQEANVELQQLKKREWPM